MTVTAPGGVLLFRALSRSGGSTPAAPAPPSAEQLLAERFARGEIDEDEYRRRLTVLRGHTGTGGTRPHADRLSGPSVHAVGPWTGKAS